MTMIEKTITDWLVQFQIGEIIFIAEFIHPAEGQPGLVENENKWRLQQEIWQSHKQGKPIKQRRWKRIGYFDSLEECREELRKRD